MAHIFQYRRIDRDLFLLTLVVLLQNLPFFNPAILPSHDTQYMFSIFHYFYSAFLFDFDIPYWMHSGVYGLPSLCEQLGAIQPAGYFVALMGWLFNVESVLFLFKLSVLIDQLMFLIGMYLLSKQLFDDRNTVLLVCIGAIGGTVWLIQIGFSFLIYYLIPLVLYFVFRYIKEQRPEFLWIAGMIAVVSFLGGYAYVAPIYLLVVTIVFCVLQVKYKDAWRSIFSLSVMNLTLFMLFFFVAATLLYFAAHVLDFSSLYHGSEHSSGAFKLKAFSLKGFLTHGNDLISTFKFPEFISGMRIYQTPVTLYVGILPLVFFCWSIIKVRTFPFLALILAAFALIGLSGGGIMAAVLYFFPGMFFFWHIGHIYGLSKLLILICSGYGIDYFWSEMRNDQFFKSIKESKFVTKTFSPFTWFVILLGYVFFVDIFISYYFHNFTTPDTVKTDILSAIIFSMRVLMYLIALCYVCRIIKESVGSKHAAVKRIELAIIICFAVDMFSFQAVAYFSVPGIDPSLASKLDSLKVSRLNFQEERSLQLDTDRPANVFEIFTRKIPYRNTVYTNGLYSIMQYDPCYPVEGLQTFFFPIGVDHLIRLRGGRPKEFGDRSFLPLSDTSLLKTIGCNSPKLRLVSNVMIAGSMDEAASIIKTAGNLEDFVVLRNGESYVDHLSADRDSVFNESGVSVDSNDSKDVSFSCLHEGTDFLKIKMFWETTKPFPHWIQYDSGYTSYVTSYFLQTGIYGSDSTERMPGDWEFQGSDDGSDWTTIDKRSGEANWKNGERRVYRFTSADGYRYYRLYITSGAIGKSILRLSELGMEFHHPALPKKWEDIVMSVDSSDSFKDFLSHNDGTFWETVAPFPHWIQSKFGMKSNAASYFLEAGRHGVDSTGRMPRDWVFQGSDDGRTWVTLDERKDEVRWSTGERRTYQFSNPDGFYYYRLFIFSGINDHILRLSDFGIHTNPLITVNEFSANKLELRINSFQDQWLVYADSFHPGWKASLNGMTVPIMEANLAFKAIKLEQGMNHVMLTFDNGLFSWISILFALEGVGITFICLISLLILIVKPANRSSRKPIGA